ncbi:conserved protein of unknown function [Tenacibaculum sp. 190130A14a]|uniref:Tetratricopeptide repeat protein n=1 Tax=Tenacibaculum polynesiense TaxID=3137857 RepID=A0ABM9PCW4_9FLAO
MEKDNYIKLLENAPLIQTSDTLELKGIIDKHPYFQSARALYLKALKNQDSFKYNNQLKKTAAYTTNRTVLFEFITSKNFEVVTKKEEKFSLKSILTPKKKAETSKIEEQLEIGKPLSFTNDETFSFNQWLQLSSKKPINRDNVSEEATENEDEKSNEQDDIINRFIANSPKIPRPNKSTPLVEIKAKETQDSTQLMTETLAKVYLEQKKYDSAIQAYKILSLKYPEKSGFFADQIKKIQTLQNNK